MKYQCDCEQDGHTDNHKVQQGRGTMKLTLTKEGICVYCGRYAVAQSMYKQQEDIGNKYYADPMVDLYHDSNVLSKAMY